jgi:hypothetical protein
MSKHVLPEQIQHELDETRATLPIYDRMADLFTNKRMFSSFSKFESAGFRLVTHAEHKIMLGGHKATPGYLFKKYNDDKPGKKQILNYMRRIQGARLLREFITARGFSRVVAPRKWLYDLGSGFPERYLVVVDKLKLRSDEETQRAYHRISKEQLRELATILFYFRGLNSWTKNLPFTDDGKIAFIDTERWPNNKDFLRKIGEHLPPDRKDLAEEIYDDLKHRRERPFTSAFKGHREHDRREQPFTSAFKGHRERDRRERPFRSTLKSRTRRLSR